MKNRFFIFIMLSAFMALSISCNRNNNIDDDQPSDEINVPDGFTFETTKEISISIKMPSSINFKDYRGRFNIYSNNPDDGGKLLYSGSFDNDGTANPTFKIPAKTTKVYVSTIAGSMYVDVSGNFKSGGADADFEENYIVGIPPDSINEGFKSTGLNNNIIYNNKNIEAKSNAITNGDFNTDDFGEIYWWNSPHPIDHKWYLTTHYPKMERFDVGGSHGYILRTQSLNAHYAGGASQMIEVDENDLVTMTADIKATSNNHGTLRSWLYLIPYDVNNNPLDYFAIELTPPPTDWNNEQVVATMPAGTVKCSVLLWAHDLAVNESVMFDNVVVTITGPDSDNDGVPDDDDDYPNDPTRAFNVYYPNETDWGTLAFEDLWPGEGDYDFNDLIYDYHFKSVLNAQNKLVEFYIDYSVRAIGASLENGLGIMLGGDPSNIESVTGANLTENFINLNNNGTEQGQSKTVIILFDNAYSFYPSAGSYFVNTLPEKDYITPDTNQFYVKYGTPIDVNITGTAPYNPFLIINKTRGMEVHLPGYEPTDLADQSLFGTHEDDTDPATGKYYQTVNNLPWAIDLPVSFDYPVEKVKISEAYNHFVEWAESAGNSYPDWYEDNAGYRNSSNIYTPDN